MERSREELSREKFMSRRRVPALGGGWGGGGASSFPSVNRSFADTEACKQKREEKKHKIYVKRRIISHENKSECSRFNNWGKSLTRYLAESAMSAYETPRSIGPFIMK